MIEQILLMCAIVGLSPVEVDCNTQWLLIQEDSFVAPFRNENGMITYYKGTAVYDYARNPVGNTYPELSEYNNLRWINVANLKQDNCWNEEMTEEPTGCIPLIWHEIKHQVCTCNWHENLIKTFKSFKGAFGGI